MAPRQRVRNVRQNTPKAKAASPQATNELQPAEEFDLDLLAQALAEEWQDTGVLLSSFMSTEVKPSSSEAVKPTASEPAKPTAQPEKGEPAEEAPAQKPKVAVASAGSGFTQ